MEETKNFKSNILNTFSAQRKWQKEWKNENERRRRNIQEEMFLETSINCALRKKLQPSFRSNGQCPYFNVNTPLHHNFRL